MKILDVLYNFYGDFMVILISLKKNTMKNTKVFLSI